MKTSFSHFLIIFVLLFFFTSCPFVSVELTSGGSKYQILETKRFDVLQFNSNGDPVSTNFNFNCIRNTSHLEIYLKQGQTMSSDDLDYISDGFEYLYTPLTTIFGTHTDRDGNGKIIILLYDINQNLNVKDGYYAGFFNPNDILYHNTEILYVESKVSNNIAGIFSTIIHEFQHLINASMDIKTKRPTDLWLNEALSASAEILIFDKKTNFGPMMPWTRWTTYNNAPYNTIIQEGNYFYNWNYHDNTVLADYATVSLFMYWLFLNGGEDTIKHIANASVSGTYEAVLEAVSKSSSPKLTGLNSWQEVLFAWLKANENASEGYPNGMWGYISGNTLYRDALLLESKIYSGGNQSVDLFPGDAVITDTEYTGNYLVSSEIASGIHVTLNTDVTVKVPPRRDGEYAPSTPITLSATPIMARSIQSIIPSIPDFDNRIIPLSQKPYSADDLEAINQ